MNETQLWTLEAQIGTEKDSAQVLQEKLNKTPVQFRSGDQASNMHRWQGALRSEGHQVIGIPVNGAVRGAGLRWGLKINPTDPGQLIGIEWEPSLWA